MINVVIFSKNRAAQLDLLLRSFKEYFKEYSLANISVVYSYSSDEFKSGYKKLEDEIKNVSFIHDLKYGSFKETMLKTINASFSKTMFLVDDIVFKDYFSVQDQEIQILENEQIIATSLRLWKGIDHCYAINQPSPPPSFINKHVWNWTVSSGDWGYPMSVDGNVFRTDFICNKINQINFANPNQFEAGLAAYADRTKQYMSCYTDASKLLNIPANLVQNVFKNRHGSLNSVEELNDSFLKGKKLSYDHITNCKNNTVHMEIPLIWIED